VIGIFSHRALNLRVPRYPGCKRHTAKSSISIYLVSGIRLTGVS
jgi:hypothetical protein